MSKNRKKIPKKKSEGMFKSTASKTHPVNTKPRPMRGGTRF